MTSVTMGKLHADYHKVKSDELATHWMIDLETLGVGHAPPILSVGAVRFNPFGTGVAEEFYRRVDVDSALACGKPSGSTFRWWLTQSEEARLEIANGPVLGTLPLFDVLDQLRVAMSFTQVEGVWGNGSLADIVWLESAYAAHPIPLPWTYREVMDFRTLRWLCPDVSYQDYLGEDTAHHALADARAQALACQEMMRRISVRELEQLAWLGADRNPPAT